MPLFILVEDGSIVEGANTYVDPDGDVANDYFDAHLYAGAWTSASMDSKTKAVIMATRYVDDLIKWKGSKVDADQPRSWPRKDVYLENRYLANDTIPLDIQIGVCETALAFLTGDRISDTAASAGISSIGLGNGAISLQFNQPDPTRNLSIIPQQVALVLGKYGIVQTKGFQQIPVSR
jgi:hypothetical protein